MPVRMRTKIRKYFSFTLDQSYVSVGNISGWHVSMGQGLSRLALNSPCRDDVWKTFYFAGRGLIYISGGSTDLMSVWYIWDASTQGVIVAYVAYPDCGGLL